jgi:ribosomal-protein-alanine N-acetyltransferase
MIGTCGFTNIYPQHDSAEIGYVINPAYRGKGIAVEAAMRVIDFGFSELGLNRIEAKYIVGNDASRRVMEKLGMSFEGVMRSSMLVKDRYRDIGVFSILKNEFKK